MSTHRHPKFTALVFVLTAWLGPAVSAQDKPAPQPDLVLDRKLAELDKLKAEFKVDSKSPTNARNLAQAMGDLAAYYAKRSQKGDWERAFTYYNSTLELRELILRATDGEPLVARTVSATLNELGELLVLRGQPGDLEKALEHVTRSFEVSDGLFKKHPESAEFARDTAVSLDRLGSLLVKRNADGDRDKALAHFTRALDITETAYKLKPDSAEAARDLALSLERMASFLRARGDEKDRAAIRSQLLRSLELRESVSKKNPTSNSASLDLSVSLEKLGDFLFEQGNPDEIETIKGHYVRCLTIREGLLKAAPNSGSAARALCVALTKLGDFLATFANEEDLPVILGHFTRDLEISERLFAANPTSTQAAHDVIVSRYKLGKFTELIEKPEDSERHFRACFALLKKCVGEKMPFDAATMKLLDDLKLRFDAEAGK